MKKIASLIFLALLFGCKSANVTEQRPLHEILIQKPTGGAQVRFFEILTEPEEFLMIKNDPELKGKIKGDEIAKANFLILSAGEKPTGGYGIGIKSVVETDRNIIVTVEETAPEPGAMVTMAMTTPYCVVRINSKKEVIFAE